MYDWPQESTFLVFCSCLLAANASAQSSQPQAAPPPPPNQVASSSLTLEAGFIEAASTRRRVATASRNDLEIPDGFR